jgi:hypothetical protein
MRPFRMTAAGTLAAPYRVRSGSRGATDLSSVCRSALQMDLDRADLRAGRAGLDDGPAEYGYRPACMPVNLLADGTVRPW